MMEPKRPSDLLGGILKQARTLSSREKVSRALARVLGEHDAPHCRVVGSRSGRLVVEVDSAPLFAELQGFRAEELRLGLNEQLDGPKVAELVFRLHGTGHG